MHRTQIYFEEDLFEKIKKEATTLGVSISSYIRDSLKKQLLEKETKSSKKDFSQFAGMWRDRDMSVEELRKKAWK